MTELPLFPLSAVLLPHGRMPLRIFEQRYLDLVRDTMRNDSSFGMVWIISGSEVAQRGQAAPRLGDYGTRARIVDWDQLPDGLLGVSIEGVQRFELLETETRANGLVVGSVRDLPAPRTQGMRREWLPMLDVLRSLEAHPHVQRLGLDVDFNDAWQVAYTLVQVLPIEESLKYKMLGIDQLDDLMGALHALLNRVSGEE
ncbi:MAG: LON peptidase substrate-binding domain-containing protein [Halioglobus sp.]|nr:LON peptidase substrate-binding domain-containing protein [Halioglobus sp.]